jgi:hypothetical protein
MRLSNELNQSMNEGKEIIASMQVDNENLKNENSISN